MEHCHKQVGCDYHLEYEIVSRNTGINDLKHVCRNSGINYLKHVIRNTCINDLKHVCRNIGIINITVFKEKDH